MHFKEFSRRIFVCPGSPLRNRSTLFLPGMFTLTIATCNARQKAYQWGFLCCLALNGNDEFISISLRDIVAHVENASSIISGPFLCYLKSLTFETLHGCVGKVKRDTLNKVATIMSYMW